jgi:hypothetical protein
MHSIDPAAAAVFASSLAGMGPELRRYKGLEGQAAQELLEYLEALQH